METIKVKARTGEDGVLKLEVPTGLTSQEIEVMRVLDAKDVPAVDALGWPIGFFDRTYGA